MADGDTDWYGSDSSMTLEIWNDDRRLIGLPHLSKRDDVYRGYFIPKGQIGFPARFFLLRFTSNLLVQKDLQ